MLALGGLGLAVRSRAWDFVAFAAAALGGAIVFVGFASPWIGGKSIATASPAFLAAALVPIGMQLPGHRGLQIGHLVAGLAGLAVVAGVAWSNVLAYHDVTLAPRDRYAELETIGKRFAGAGPALMPEYDSYGPRHFLRRLDPESASELRRRFDTLRTGRPLETGAFADIDELQLADVLVYRTLVVRRSPATSRPPSVYSRVWQGGYYEVWQRPDTYPQIVEHLSLGDHLHVAAVPKCDDVLRLARAAGSTGRLVAVPRLDDAALALPDTLGLRSRGGYGEEATARYFTGKTTWTHTIVVPAAGDYDVGIAGSFRGRLDLAVDGTRVASARHRLNWPGQYEHLARVQLAPGQHELRFVYHGADLLPGSASPPPFGTGPVAVGPSVTAEPALITVQPSDARSLCGRSVDWVEAVR